MPSEGESRVWVVGLGTPFGDDQVGWEVVARLRDSLPERVRADGISNPLALAEVPLGCRLLIVIDAGRGAGPPGSLHRFTWPDARLTATRSVSSHGIGLTAALELVTALGRLPPRVVVFAIEGHSTDPGTGLSQVVETAIPEAVARVLAEIATESTDE